MYCITEQQIDFILNDIGARGVKMESLQQNLLDHICCIVEQNLEENGNFESFYAVTIKTFYAKELCEIEEETKLLLTFKNYYAMKKTMIFTGVISVAAFILGSFLKIMHWPGAGIMLLLAIVTVSLIFLPLVFVLKIKEVNATRDKLILALGTVLGILYFISMLFQVMHWPGGHIIWLATLALSTFVFIPSYFFSGIRQPETKVNTIVATILLVAATGSQFTLTRLYPPEKGKTVLQNDLVPQQAIANKALQFHDLSTVKSAK